MQEIDFYKAIALMRKETLPFTVVFVHLSLSKNEGGGLDKLENVLVGALKKNMQARFMIGFKDPKGLEIRHIYLHSILELKLQTGEHYKLVLK